VVVVSRIAVQEPTYTIAEVAKQTGVTAHTLRDDERIGLVDVGRHTSGHRRFSTLEAHRTTVRTRLHELEAALDAIEYKIARYGGSCAP
jgi:DNA-binding transcriptional MerR regulator